MGLWDRLRMERMLNDGPDPGPDPFTPAAPLAPVDVVTVERREQVGQHGWQMRQLLESEQRSDAAAARAVNRLNRLVQSGGGKFSHVHRDGTVETFQADQHREQAPVHEPADPLYSHSSRRPSSAGPHTVDRMSAAERERQQSAPFTDGFSEAEIKKGAQG